MPDELTTTELTDRLFLTATEVAERLGVSDKTIRKRIANGDIHARKRGRVWQISSAEVERITEQSADPWETPTEPTDRNGTEQMDGRNGTLTAPRSPEKEHLRCDLDAMTERALSAEKRLESALDSIGGLTEQIDHLTQLLALKEKNVAALTEQLDSSRQMIEDMRHRKPLWKRLFRRNDT